jgi:hypothetical protein
VKADLLRRTEDKNMPNILPKTASVPVPRLRLKSGVNVEKIRKLIDEITDKRFYRLQKRLILDLDMALFKTIDLGVYIRLSGWSHTSGSYVHAMSEVNILCKAMFGYELPTKIGEVLLRNYRYRTTTGLSKVGRLIEKYHESKIKKET